MKRHNLFLYACLALFTFSCAKDNTEKLSATNKIADDGNGIGGAGGCWDTYFAAVKSHLDDPSDVDFIPGQAELDLTSCLSPYETIGGSGSGLTLYPPATPPVLTLVPVPGVTDNLSYLVFFGLNSASTNADYANAVAVFQHFTNIVRAAFAAGYLQGTDPQAKISACGAYVAATPGLFTSTAEQLQFFAYLHLVFPLDHTFTIDVRPTALRTDLFSFDNFDYSPISLVFTIGSPF